MNARDLWDEFRAQATLPVETPEEIALQKYAFVCGLVRGLGGLALGHDPQDMMTGVQELIEEARQDIWLAVDRRPSLKESDN
jgi:HD-like signal output (HDOD) protein